VSTWARQVFALRAAELFDQRVHHQQCGGDFHRQIVRVLQRVAAQPLAQVEQRGRESCEVGLTDASRSGDHGFALFVELGQSDRRAGRKTRPRVLALAERFAQRGQRRAQRAQVVRSSRIAVGQQGVEAIGVAHLADPGCRLFGGGDEVERVAHQTLGHTARSFEQAAHLHVDARAQALDEEIAADGALRQSVGQCAAHPPEGACRRYRLHLFDRADGLTHLRQAFAIIAQEAQQPAFELAARRAQRARAVERRQGRRHLMP
jgi:hypothetical protein